MQWWTTCLVLDYFFWHLHLLHSYIWLWKSLSMNYCMKMLSNATIWLLEGPTSSHRVKISWVLHSALISLVINGQLSDPKLMLYFISSLPIYYFAFIFWRFQDIFMCADVEGVIPHFISLTHWKKLWCWEGLGAGGEGDDRGWDGWMASLTRWMWVPVNSGSWWWTGRPGVLQFMGSQSQTRLSDWTELKAIQGYLSSKSLRSWPSILSELYPNDNSLSELKLML